MIEFRVNDYITLRLEDDTTNIYVNDELFNQCASILFQIPTISLGITEEIESIDNVAEKLGWTVEGQYITIDKNALSPKEEFRGHCSNLQVWAENNYDSRLLHSNLSFPLLKKLTEVGDPDAIKVFKEEISKRFELGNHTVIFYLLEEKYIDFLDPEELDYVIQNSEIVEHLFKNGDLEQNERFSYFSFFHQRAPMALKKKFFDEKNNLKEIIRNLLEEFKITRYSMFETLFLLFKNDPILKESLLRGIAEIFQKGTFSLIEDLLGLLNEGFKHLDDIIEQALTFNLFTKDTVVIQAIFDFLKGDDIYAKRNSVGILSVIWRYMDHGLSEEIIKCIMEDEINRIDLLLRLITVWYEKTTALNSDAITKLERLGDHAYQELKKALKGGPSDDKAYSLYIEGKLDKLIFRSDLQERWYDFNYTIEVIYSLFGAQELIEYLDRFEEFDDLTIINKNNYPGPLNTLTEAFIECSENNDAVLINKACNMYLSLNSWNQEPILQYLTYGEWNDDRQKWIEFCIKNDRFEAIRFFLNFKILSRRDIGWLSNIPNVNFLEKLIESQKELKYPSEKYDLFLEEMVYADHEQFINSILKIDFKEQKGFLIYLSDLMNSFTKTNFPLSFSSFLGELDSKVIETIEGKTGKKFRVIGDALDDPYAEVAFSYEDGNVTGIIMKWCGLKTVPEEISNLTYLKRLILRNNFISSIPESLGKLQNLEFLDVSNNRDLSEIPDAIKKIKGLKQIIFR